MLAFEGFAKEGEWVSSDVVLRGNKPTDLKVS
uniref:Uncharacterized protein n=1 Tax=Rhizophora mucronata TaxID=61149 RepID=A0A2P2NU98_RHIMU